MEYIAKIFWFMIWYDLMILIDSYDLIHKNYFTSHFNSKNTYKQYVFRNSRNSKKKKNKW